MDRKALVVLIGVALLAGCARAPSTVDPPEGSPAGPRASDFRLEASGCAEAGAYVTWNAMPDDPDLPRGFDVRDVSADLGNPPITTIGGGPTVQRTPADAIPGSNVTGAYHPIMYCPTWALDGVEKMDLWMAWVAALVHPPSYDPAPVAREYSVGAVGVNDADLAARLTELGVAVEALRITDFAIDATNMRHAFDYAHHGVIYADVPMRLLREKPSEVTRLWVVATAPATEGRPVALDFTDEGGEHLVASAPGAFEHTVNGPAPAAVVPLHTFTSWALAYTGVTRTITIGPVVDVIVDADGHVHGGHQTAADAKT